MSARRRLVLVRHSLPDIRPELPAPHWRLSAEGLARARRLARRLDPASARAVFSSAEPKALETAGALAEAWGLPVQEVPGLHEHERPQAQMLSREEFQRTIRELFARPGELVFGVETAEGARRRFTAALMRVVMREPGDVVAVTHGTVMALFVAAAAGLEPYAFWKRQQMPCAVTLSLPDLAYTGTTVLTD